MAHWQYYNFEQIPFQDFLAHQERLFEARTRNDIPNTIIFAEHKPAISLGARPDQEQLHHILVAPEELSAKEVPIIKTQRGGSVAVHGPGILGIYVVLDTTNGHSPGSVIRSLEWWLQDTLLAFGLKTQRLVEELRTDCKNRAKYEGLWVGKKKISSIGIRIAKNVTKFGMNLNMHPEDWLLRLIYHCGIEEYEITSLEKENIVYSKQKIMERLSDSVEYFF